MPLLEAPAWLARPMVLINRRTKWLEKVLDLPLSDRDIAVIRSACARGGGQRLGHYYHWYFLKALQARAIRRANREWILRMVRGRDRTDYSAVNSLPSGRGVLVAMPHHAHYVFSMIALARHLQRFQRVNIFYGAPGTHRGNEVFDTLHEVLWTDDSGVRILHDDRRGLAQALDSLRNGETVMIMPDVFRDESATLFVPFCGRPMNVMLGAATMARRSEAVILPAVSQAIGRGMGFATRFGALVEPGGTGIPPGSNVARLVDYAAMRRLFARFELLMGDELIYWQNVRQHLARAQEFPEVKRHAMDRVAALLESSPLMQGPLTTVDLRP
ncbi:hypothetical protein GCM10028862_04700 [Luteimonas pelagia]